MNEWMTAKIQECYIRMRPSERRVADCLLEYEGRFEGLGLTDVCTRAGVSQPTVLRFARALGYSGYKEFKMALAQGQAREESRGGKEEEAPLMYGFKIRPEDPLETVPGKVIGTSLQMLKDTVRSLSLKEYQRAVKAILKAERIVIFAAEDSAVAAQDLMIKLLYLGKDCKRCDDFYLQHVSAGNMTQKDLAIGISYSGCSKITVELMRKAKRSGAATLVITNFENALISRYGDTVLCTSSRQFLYGDAIFSRITQLAIVDMLYMGVINSDYTSCSRSLKRNSRMVEEMAYDPKQYPDGGREKHAENL